MERLGYWIDEGYLGCYSSWGSCGVVELPGVWGVVLRLFLGWFSFSGLVEEGLVGLSPALGATSSATGWGVCE